jgi:hypothetical protein
MAMNINHVYTSSSSEHLLHSKRLELKKEMDCLVDEFLL